jgi:hypothetical protein
MSQYLNVSNIFPQACPDESGDLKTESCNKYRTLLTETTQRVETVDVERLLLIKG